MSDSPAHVTLEAVDGEHETVRYDDVSVLDSGALHCRNGTFGDGDVVEITYHSPLSWHTVEVVPQQDRDTDQSPYPEAATGDLLVPDSDDGLDIPGGVCKGP